MHDVRIDLLWMIEVKNSFSFRFALRANIPLVISLKSQPSCWRVRALIRSSLTINPVHQLNTANLTLLKLVQTIKHALESARAKLDRVHRELLAGDELRSQVPERLCEFEVFWLGGHIHAAGPLEGFAGEGVAESGLGGLSVGVIFANG